MPSQPGTSLFDATPFDLVPIHIFVVESSGAIRYANEAFARYTGSSDARLSPLELTHEADVEAVLAAWRPGRPPVSPTRSNAGSVATMVTTAGTSGR